VLIRADVARIPETGAAIAQIPEVTEVYSVTGDFDLVALVRVRAHEELNDVIPGTLNRVSGVTHTETHIAFQTYSRHDLEAAFALGYPEAGCARLSRSPGRPGLLGGLGHLRRRPAVLAEGTTPGTPRAQSFSAARR
jgi:hypothetical protein